MPKIPNMDRRIVLKTLCCVGALVPMVWSARNATLIPWKNVFGSSPDLPSDLASDTRGVLTESRAIMGTVVSVILAQVSQTQMQEAMGLAFQCMDSLIPVYDRHNSSSVLSALNQQGHLRDAPPALVDLLRRSREYGHLTGNAFNIAVQPLLDLWQHYANPQGNMSIPADDLHAAQELARPDALSIEGRQITLGRSGMGLTLDGIAKGHIADEVSRVLIAQGINNHLVNAGGDIVARGEKAPGKAWAVAVENPAAVDNPELRQRQPHVAVLELRDKAIATSGSYRIYFDAERRHNHLISVAGVSPVEIVSATVLADNAAEADALATALAVMEPKDGVRLADSLPNHSCLLVKTGGGIMKSKGWLV